jgi:homoserine O-acetyltransferase
LSSAADSSVGIVVPQRALFSEPLILNSGRLLPQFELVYETYGQLREDGSNAVLICHALSGNHHAAGRYEPDDRKPGWWEVMIGPGKPIDTERLFVVCLNNLGGCDGSTGPGSINPDTGAAWGSSFPQIEVEDWVASQKRLAEHLGIGRWAAVIGGSLGGMQALAWAVLHPEWVEHCVALAAAPGLTAQNIAFNEIARHAILSDPAWANGDYHHTETVPEKGLALARMVGHLTYMSADGMSDRFGRELREDGIDNEEEVVFQVESYLRYQGHQFSTRFDANTYLLMTRALDRFDLAARHDGDLAAALAESQASFLIASFSTDWRFSPARSREIVNALLAARKPVSYANIETDAGHDGFLLPIPSYLSLMHQWMRRVAA